MTTSIEDKDCYRFTVHVRPNAVGARELMAFDCAPSSLIVVCTEEGIIVISTTRAQMKHFSQTIGWIVSYDEMFKEDSIPCINDEPDFVFDPAFLRIW